MGVHATELLKSLVASLPISYSNSAERFLNFPKSSQAVLRKLSMELVKSQPATSGVVHLSISPSF